MEGCGGRHGKLSPASVEQLRLATNMRRVGWTGSLRACELRAGVQGAASAPRRHFVEEPCQRQADTRSVRGSYIGRTGRRTTNSEPHPGPSLAAATSPE